MVCSDKGMACAVIWLLLCAVVRAVWLAVKSYAAAFCLPGGPVMCCGGAVK